MYVLLITAIVIAANIDCRSLPMLFPKSKRDVISREKVRQLQLQTMLKGVDEENNRLYSLIKRRSADIEEKREADDIGDSSEISQLFEDNSPWDMVPKQVPFHALLQHNKLVKREISSPSRPCKRRRSTAESEEEKRSLLSPAGDGLAAGYNMYDEQCEDSQPVEIVKIDKLVVEDGIIRDQNIIEKAML